MNDEDYSVVITPSKALQDQLWKDFLRLATTYSLKFIVAQIAHRAYVEGYNARRNSDG